MIESLRFKLHGYKKKYAEIELNGKNLIITGQNGCGKTRFLTQLNKIIEDSFNRRIKDIETLNSEISYYKKEILRITPSSSRYGDVKTFKNQAEEKLKRWEDENFTLLDKEFAHTKFDNKELVIHYFDVSRLNKDLAGNGTIVSIDSLKKNEMSKEKTKPSRTYFEDYLVSYYNYASHLIAREKDTTKSEKIDRWFASLERDLQTLFEDEKLKLEYDAEKHFFFIQQEGKEPFRFNELSSGYSSILTIYAELLMKVELKDIPASELHGFVFIDEIDVHLHVSIQKKIFSFFTETFPKIQFFITTHSPFVIQSVDDAIIYDLSTGESLEDLSMYSYQAILKGLLGVDTISAALHEKINILAELIQHSNPNITELKSLFEEISPNEQDLDIQSRAFLALAKNKLIDLDSEV